MRALMAAVACATAVVSVGCDAPKAPAAQGEASSLAQVKTKLDKLVAAHGQDAYHRDEVAQLLRDLAQVPAGSPDKEAALELADFLRAKRRIADTVMNGPRPRSPTPEGAPNYGPVVMEGPRPTEQPQLDAVAKLKVGASRDELVATLGGCLVRQTWFQGRNGGPTVELFHVAKDCRGTLDARIYRVSGGVVDEIKAGQLDSVMTGSSQPEVDSE